MDTQAKSYGYYLVTLSSQAGCRLLHSNNERAFVISQLQDLLSPRLLLGSVPPHKQLASSIDLLAFSITSGSIQLLLFSIDSSIVSRFTASISTRLTQYQYEYSPTQLENAHALRWITKKLRGPHHALSLSITTHLSHEDWEYDRYSSIGFYLHDRRGDWMRTWRLAQLYDTDASNYRLLIQQRQGEYTKRPHSMLQSSAS
jgi:hypothetical protein